MIMNRLSAILLLLSLSVVAALAQGDWTKYTSPEGRYNVLLPREPNLSSQDGTAPSGEKFTQYLAASPDSTGDLFMVAYFDYTAGMVFSFDKARDGMVAAVKGTLVSERPISLGSSPGRELKVLARAPTGNEYMVLARYYQVGTRIYVVQMIVQKSDEANLASPKATRYFDSFQVSK